MIALIREQIDPLYWACITLFSYSQLLLSGRMRVRRVLSLFNNVLLFNNVSFRTRRELSP